jgi:hypothetical protein
MAHPEILIAFWILTSGLIVAGASWVIYRRITDMGILGRRPIKNTFFY